MFVSLCCAHLTFLPLLPAAARRSFGHRGRRGHHVVGSLSSEYSPSSPVCPPRPASRPTLLVSPSVLLLRLTTHLAIFSFLHSPKNAHFSKYLFDIFRSIFPHLFRLIFPYALNELAQHFLYSIIFKLNFDVTTFSRRVMGASLLA